MVWGCRYPVTANTFAAGVRDTSNNAGSVRIYKRQPDNTYSLVDTIARPANWETLIYFGQNIALDETGSTMLVSRQAYSTIAGRFSVFVRSGETWTEQHYQMDPTGDINSYFGYRNAISADGDTLAVSGRQYDSNKGILKVYRRNNSSWSELGSFTGATNNRLGGECINVVNGGNLVIANRGGTNPGMHEGGFRVYEYNGSSWTSRSGTLPQYTATSSTVGNYIHAAENGQYLIAQYVNGSVYQAIFMQRAANGDWTEVDATTLTGTSRTLRLSSDTQRMIAASYGDGFQVYE